MKDYIRSRTHLCWGEDILALLEFSELWRWFIHTFYRSSLFHVVSQKICTIDRRERRDRRIFFVSVQIMTVLMTTMMIMTKQCGMKSCDETSWTSQKKDKKKYPSKSFSRHIFCVCSEWRVARGMRWREKSRKYGTEHIKSCHDYSTNESWDGRAETIINLNEKSLKAVTLFLFFMSIKSWEISCLSLK